MTPQSGQKLNAAPLRRSSPLMGLKSSICALTLHQRRFQHAVQLHLLHTGLSYLVSLFPVDRTHMPEAGVYNDKMRQHAAGVRDFQAAHFRLNRRFGERFWDAAREAQPSSTLARKLELFAARGVVAMEEHETFQEENWTSIFVGHRLLPATWDPQVEKVPESTQEPRTLSMARSVGIA